MPSSTRIILGSGSPRRRKILGKLNISFDVVSPEIDEKSIRHASPQILTKELAHAKNRAIQQKISSPAVILTADTVVACHGVIYEKSKSAEEGIEWLRSFANKTVTVHTTIVAHNTTTKNTCESSDSGSIYFSPIPDSELLKIAEKGFQDCAAGGFNIEDVLLAPYVSIVGDLETILGMSRIQVIAVLKELALA